MATAGAVWALLYPASIKNVATSMMNVRNTLAKRAARVKPGRALPAQRIETEPDRHKLVEEFARQLDQEFRED